MKLLNKSIQPYLVYSSLLLLIAIPVFYLVIQQLVGEDVDESLMVKKTQLIKKLEKTNTQDLYAYLHAFDSDINLSPSSHFQPRDSFYTIKEYDTISKENIPYRILESHVLLNNDNYSLKLKSSLLDSKDLIERIVIIVAILMILIIAGLFVINRVISRKIWQPFYSTLKKLRHYRIEKNETVSFDKTDIDELADLNTTISSLTQRNQHVYQSQKEFTENASHELQTPLAVFQGKLDLLMQTSPLHQEQATLISDLADASQRLNKLNKSLLLLTKIENNQFPEIETIPVVPVIERLIDQYMFQIEKKNIALQFKYENSNIINANRALCEILFSNLLSNAIRYTPENGSIDLHLKDNILTIRNTGIEMPLDQSKIFYRFHKESANVKSIGLGLAIAQKITDLYAFKLNYAYTEGLHSFTVFFKPI